MEVEMSFVENSDKLYSIFKDDFGRKKKLPKIDNVQITQLFQMSNILFVKIFIAQKKACQII